MGIVFETPVYGMTDSKIGVHRAGKPYLGRADARVERNEAIQLWLDLIEGYGLKLVKTSARNPSSPTLVGG